MESRRHHPTVDPAEVEFAAVRAQGAGGQNVNKVSNAAHLRFDVRASSLPEDVKALAVPAFGHRITLRPEMWVRSMHGSDVVEQLLARLPVPRASGPG